MADRPEHPPEESLESLAQQVPHSLAVKVDEFIKPLGEMPEEAMEPLLGLVKLKRHGRVARRRLLQFLQEVRPS